MRACGDQQELESWVRHVLRGGQKSGGKDRATTPLAGQKAPGVRWWGVQIQALGTEHRAEDSSTQGLLSGSRGRAIIGLGRKMSMERVRSLGKRPEPRDQPGCQAQPRRSPGVCPGAGKGDTRREKSCCSLAGPHVCVTWGGLGQSVRQSWGAASQPPVPMGGPATLSPLATTAPARQATQVSPLEPSCPGAQPLTQGGVGSVTAQAQAPGHRGEYEGQGVKMRKGGRGGGERQGRGGEGDPFPAPPVSSGPTCHEEVTACYSEPCLNGGSCSPRPGGYSCTCPQSHTGPQCQTSADHCVSGE